MIILIKKAKIYNPDYLGKKDVLLIGDKIGAVEEDIQIELNGAMDVTIIDGKGKVAVPGFIDSHVHILGGGGEGGFKTRTPEIMLTDLTKAGITTVVGCLGTDGVGRNMVSLLAKAKGLEEEGLTAFIYSGSYQIPVGTITGNVIKEFMVIDKVIGIGEIALSDHRSSQPTMEEFRKLAAEARVGGMLSGKAGILNIHLGDGKRMIEMIFKTLEETEIPPYQFLPTHANRNAALFEECVKFAKMGGCIDLTGSEDIDFWEEQDGEVRVCKAIKRLLDEGVSCDNFTLSSDAQGSMPVFNEKKECVGLGIGKASCLLKEIKECVFKENIPLEIAVRAITSNPAQILKIRNKGRILKGFDADVCLLDEDTLDIETVIAKGQIMIKDKQIIVKGTFE